MTHSDPSKPTNTLQPLFLICCSQMGVRSSALRSNLTKKLPYPAEDAGTAGAGALAREWGEGDGRALDPATLVRPANAKAQELDAAAANAARSAAIASRPGARPAPAPAASSAAASTPDSGSDPGSWPLFLALDANCAVSELQAALEEAHDRPCYIIDLPSQAHLFQIRSLQSLAAVVVSAITSRLCFVGGEMGAKREPGSRRVRRAGGGDRNRSGPVAAADTRHLGMRS